MKLTNHQLCQAKDYESRLGLKGWFIWLCDNLAVGTPIPHIDRITNRTLPTRNIDQIIQYYADQIRKSEYYKPRLIKPITRRKHK